MTAVDQGGDAACWAHLVGEDPRGDLRGREDLEHLVRSFYRQAATDDLLGSVFAAAEVDWAGHIPKLVDFWAWQLFGERGYEGNPLLAHRPVHEASPLTHAHYERWLELFEATVDEWFVGPVAETAKLKAAKMARALERLLAGVQDRGDVAIAAPLVRRSPDPATRRARTTA